ncbi:MAG: NUDIX domain-containing protein [Nanoarchaeota archaeon]|nr:NUDIX domain-containing protein [Nanoarchaeota archaeon]
MRELPKVGLGVIILKNNNVLMQKRIGAHGEDTWCPPGGHLEFGESLEACARRETKEESGIEIKNIRFATVTNDVHPEHKLHYLTVCVLADWARGEPTITEPDRTAEIGWFDWNNLPQPLFRPMQSLLRQGYDPFTNTTTHPEALLCHP